MLSKCISGRPLFYSRLFKAVNSEHSRNYNIMTNAPIWTINTENREVNKYNSSAHCFESCRNFCRVPSILAGTVVSAQSTNSLETTEFVKDTVVQTLTASGEPTFASLGLGGYTPVGLLQSGLEFLHVSCDLPWIATIAISTIIIRILMTPLVVLTQRNTAKMCNVMPEMQEIQNKMAAAGKAGDAVDYAKNNLELRNMMKEKGFNPIKNMLTPMAQAPIFISYYLGLNAMVDAPVQSLQTGGTLWFTDLTVADPYYLLPFITCGTLALTIYLGTDGARSNHPNKWINYVIKAVPIVVFPIIMNFPSAIVVYWASSNFCSLIQAPILRIEKVRAFLKIPKINPVQPKKHEQSNINRFVQPKNVTKDVINYELLISRKSKLDPTKTQNSSG